MDVLVNKSKPIKGDRSESNTSDLDIFSANKCNKSLPVAISKYSYTSGKQVTFANELRTISDIFEKIDFVEQYLESITLQNNGILFIKSLNMLVRRDHESMKDRVMILSGGLNGMEPLHSGFVGPGMLTAAIFGDTSSSPPYVTILEGLRLLSKHNKQGILVVVMNTVANRLNFGLACQQAAHEGIKTMFVSLGEDCSGLSVDKTIGRRGLSGILFLQKIAGAMSEENRTLYEIFSVLTALKGGSLGSVNVSFGNGGMEVGSGLKDTLPGHLGTYHSMPIILHETLFLIFHPASYFSLHVEKSDSVAVIVNNSGKFSDLHLALIVKEIFYQLKILEINVARVYPGRFLTTKRGGFSISVLKASENVLKWLDAPANVMCWPNRTYQSPEPPQEQHSAQLNDSDSTSFEDIDKAKETNLGPRFTAEQANQVVAVLESVVEAVGNMEEYLNILDLDNDYGTNLKKFITGIKKEMEEKSLNIVTPYGLFNNLAEIAAAYMGGVSGAVYSIILSSAAQAFLTSSKFSSISWKMWIDAAKMSRDALGSYTRVQPGKRTIMDALHPFAESFSDPLVASLVKKTSHMS